MGYLLPLFLSEDHCSNQRVRTLIFPFDLPGFFCSVRYCSLYLTYRAIKTWVDVSPMPIWCTITISIIWGNSYFTWVIWLLYLLEFFFWIPSVTNTVFFNLTHIHILKTSIWKVFIMSMFMIFVSNYDNTSNIIRIIIAKIIIMISIYFLCL